MCKISRTAVENFLNTCKGRTEPGFSKQNRLIEKGRGIFTFKLHGHIIAKYNTSKRTLQLSNCGWLTKTTKQDLNNILTHFGTGKEIKQKAGKWYWEDKTLFKNGVKVTVNV